MDVVCRSDDLRRRMGRTLDRFRLGRKGHRLQIWYPVDEEVDRVLQTTGSAVHCALAEKGLIDPSIEDEVGMQLLGDTETMVRLVLSRIVRPKYAQQITSNVAGFHACEPIVVDSGDFEGWVVAGFRETESKISGLSSVDARITVFSGLVYDSDRHTYGNDQLPFGHADPACGV
jgi:hypothetical protein